MRQRARKAAHADRGVGDPEEPSTQRSQMVSGSATSFGSAVAPYRLLVSSVQLRIAELPPRSTPSSLTVAWSAKGASMPSMSRLSVCARRRSGMIDLPVADKPADNTPRGRLRALYDWLTGAAPSPHPSSSLASAPIREGLPARIGHYAIARKLGEGGMGVVYAARDERLERTVALKTMSSLASDETARKRFWREARAAASVNHPNVCQIYEIGEDARRAVHRHGAPGGRGARRAPAARTAERVRGGADRPRHAGRALGAARPRHRPPRSQAVQRVPHAPRREAARLRPGAARAGAIARLGRRS